MKNVLIWLLRLVAAAIMLQTLYFKFTGHEQSVRLFTQIGIEPWGRIGTGVLELIASILLLYPKTTGWGAGLGVALMSGALFFHLTKIGLSFDGDYILFTYALITFIGCTILLVLFKNQILNVLLNKKQL
jgi:uncharacterized membrane protein YphA (DoxX/SURF4 family)